MSDTTPTYSTGNSIPAPGFKKHGKVVSDEILYSYVGFTQAGVTLKPGQGVLKAGTLLVKEGGASKYYVKATDGTKASARGILRHTIDTGADQNAAVFLGNVIEKGMVHLEAVKDANSGVTLTGVLGGYANDAADYFKF